MGIRFAYRVTVADEGAVTARIVPDGLSLDDAAIVGGDGNAVSIGFSTAPWVTEVALVADESGDRVWRGGETIAMRVTFSEAVTVEDGTPFVWVDFGGLPAFLPYAPGSGRATLTFAYEAPDGVELGGIGLTANSLDKGSGRIVSAANGQAANLLHAGTDPEAVETPAEAALTASFLDVPTSHGGNAFTLELRFSEAPDISYKLLQGAEDQASVLAVSGGEVTRARRLEPGSNRCWEITVEPSAGAGDVTVSLPATADCTANGAICTDDDRPLSVAVTATVPREVRADAPFTVRLDHDSQWAAIGSIAEKNGCTSETLRKWVRHAERDQGRRAGLTSAERERLKALERENRELRRANEILRKASAYFAQAELDRRPKT